MDINYELYKVFYYVAKTLSFSEASQVEKGCFLKFSLNIFSSAALCLFSRNLYGKPLLFLCKQI